jgi:Holliday junction resolvase RusA-like endonuclease
MGRKQFQKGSKIGTATIIGGSAPVCFTNVESATRRPPLEAKKDTRFNSPVRITIVSYRSRLCDADGISAKAAIDGLVHAGILQDDSPEFVHEVRYLQVKVKNKSEEETQLIIEEVHTNEGK